MGDITKTVKEIIEEVAEAICLNYCKYPGIWDEEAEGMELSQSPTCQNRPLNRLN